MTDAPTGLEGDRLIAYDHDEMGRMQRITTFADAAGATATSEVERARNGLGQVVSEHQAHGGTVGGQTPAVQYGYDDTTDGNRFSRGLRPASMTYPDGRVLHATYSGANDAISRPDGLADDNGGSPGQPAVAVAGRMRLGQLQCGRQD